MSSQLQVTGEAKIRDIQGPVVANSGVITALDGAASQYVRGDGTLADFPTSSGGGSSVSYYLNSSVSQGTIGGVAYRELSKDPIIGTGTDIAISANGYVANYITDVNDPDVTIVPGGNFNCEFYFSVSNDTGNPSTYAELYKYDGTTFTLLGSSVGVPEYINQGTIIAPYYFAIPVPTSALALTDRLAIRIYVDVDGRTVTLHTENGHLCQVVTTLSKGMVSLNNLTDQSQFLTTGTAGTNFAIASTGDTHTFNLPVASATNTGKLSSTDWSTFNNKQNAITDPITGTGASTQIAYFNSGTSITSEAAFNYDSSTNRLGVNTSVPNATIGANAGIDSGYSLLLKNDNANYNGIGFGIDSTYGNLISTEKQGTALTRNLTLLNQSGFISLTEAGNLGVGLLTPNTGIDIYNGTTSSLWLHTANSGVTGTDGVRLALFSTNGANLRNYEGAFSITAEGDFSIITIGAENFRVNSADGSIYQSKVANAMLKSVSGVITAAVAGTDYVLPSALTGYVPTSRTLTINGTAYDLSADRSWSVGTMGGSGVSGRVAYYDGTNSITSEAGFIYDASTNRLGVNTTVPNATIGADSALDSGYGLLIKTGASNYNGIGIAIDSTYGNLISTEKLGSASARNLTLLNQSGFASLKENGSFGINTLNPAVSGVGIDIYSSTSAGLRFHTSASGLLVTDGAGINFSAGNNLGITNYEAGTIDIVTNGNSGVYIASNGYVGINGATPSVALTVTGAISQTSVTSSLIKTDSSGLLVAAVAGTDYVAPSALSSYVPTSRNLTINGTSYDLSADRSWSVGTITGSGTNGYISFFNGSTTALGSSLLYNDTTNSRIGLGTTSPLEQFHIYNASAAASFLLQTNSATAYSEISVRNASSVSTSYFRQYSSSASGTDFGASRANLATFFSNFASNFAIGTQNGGDLILGTANTERLRVLASNGNVGIGLSNPTNILHLYATAPILAIESSTTGNVFLRMLQMGTVVSSLFYNNATSTLTLSNNNSGIQFNTSGASPALSLANTGAATFSSSVRINADGQSLLIFPTTTNSVRMQIQSSGGGNMIIGTDNSTGGNLVSGSNAYASVFSSGSTKDLVLGTNSVARLTINGTSGNVGIGTSSPTAKLEIQDGHVRLYDPVSTAGAGYAVIWASNNGGTNTSFATIEGVTTSAGNRIGDIKFNTSNAGAPTERMRINSAGAILFSYTGDLLFSKPDGANYSNLLYSGANANVMFSGGSGGFGINNKANSIRILQLSDGGNLTIVGSLSKGSGSFRIDHPLESMTETHQLVHSFVEAPQADLYYRGKLTLVNGKGQANIDEVSTMTEGTFEALCREVQCFTTNETGWDLIKGKVIGNIIYIESQNTNSTDEISWLVIGERQDKHMMETEWTDENGRVIVEPLKEIKQETENK